MAGAIVQTGYNVDDSGGTSLTIATTLNGVVAGNHLVAHTGWSDVPGTVTATCSDGTSFSTGDSKRRDAGLNQSAQVFYRENVGSGSHTITVTLSSSVSFRRLRVMEVSGLQTASSLDQATGQSQTDPGTGANAVSSGASSATTNANDFVMGFTQACDSVDPGSGTLAAGTGYTLSGSNLIMQVESKSVAATGVQTATFTTSLATENYITHVVAFKEIAAGGFLQSLALTGVGS